MNLFTGRERTLLLLAVVVVLMTAISCGSGGDKPSELFKDGTALIEGISLTWKVENKRLVLFSMGKGKSANYKVSGYELVLTYDDEKSATFVKKDKLEEYAKKREEEKERIKKEAEARIGKISTYFTDSRNGQKYRAVKIGGESWMAQNVNYQTGKSWCYENDNSNCEKYGRLYDWKTAKTVCPSGWHLPSRDETEDEWNKLVAAAGGYEVVVGQALKSAYGWNGNGNGVDSYGFSALPGGSRNADGSFNNVGGRGYWWTATELVRGKWTTTKEWTSANGGSSKAYYRCMNYDGAYGRGYDGKSNGFSVRCVAD